MGYTDGTRRCHSCRHFVTDDRSGRVEALPSHCTLNPALPFPVKAEGVCSHLELIAQPAKPPLAMGELLPKEKLPPFGESLANSAMGH